MGKIVHGCSRRLVFALCVLLVMVVADLEMRYSREYNTFVNHGFRNVTSRTAVDCSGACLADHRCMSASFHRVDKICQLNNKSPLNDTTTETMDAVGWSSFYRLVLSPASCDASWHRFRDDCYMVVEVYQKWAESEAHCQSMGGHLVDIQDDTELQFVRELSVNVSDTGNYWIGLNDRDIEGNFTWSSGVQVSFLKWKNPNNALGGDCVYLFASTGLWDGQNCVHSYHSICKKSAF